MERDTDDWWLELHGKTRHVLVRRSQLIALVPPSDTGPNGDRTLLMLSNGQHIILDASIGDVVKQMRAEPPTPTKQVYADPPVSPFALPDDPNVF